MQVKRQGSRSILRMLMTNQYCSFGRRVALILGILLVTSPGVVLAESVVSVTPPATEVAAPASGGVAMMSIVGPAGVVEQLQAIHRLGQSVSKESLAGLVSALDSSYPLARRKASSTLLESIKLVEPEEKRWLVVALADALRNSDVMVRKNIVRLMAVAGVPEANQALRQFFQHSDKPSQLTAVEALSSSQGPYRQALGLVTQISPYEEVRQAASAELK